MMISAIDPIPPAVFPHSKASSPHHAFRFIFPISLPPPRPLRFFLFKDILSPHLPPLFTRVAPHFSTTRR